MGGCIRPNDYTITLNLFVLLVLVTGSVDGVQKIQNLDYVIFEWSISRVVEK